MIEKNINEVSVKNEPSARALLTSLFNIDGKVGFINAAVYHQFPIYPTIQDDETIKANVVFISQSHGIFVFQCIENDQMTQIPIYEKKLAEIDRLVFAKILKESPSLQANRRQLKVEIVPVLYINNPQQTELSNKSTDYEIVCSEVQLEELIGTYKNDHLDETDFRDIKATIEGSKCIVRANERKIKNVQDFINSKGAILTKIENEIYNFDLEQKRAALFIVDGAQRIRGLAGSGKTIILAMKAAMIHLQHPQEKILYTYYTKSLNDFVKRLITRFYRQFADKDPNWEKIDIMHAWGGKALEGVYYNTCLQNDVMPINLGEAKRKNPKNPFDFVCEQLNSSNLKKQYDYVILDEAQDLPKNFYRVCRQITTNNRVIWAYDDFQNILDIEMQDEKDAFGLDPKGEYYIDFSRRNDELQDMILHKCYRNPKKILTTAFSLGLGIYNKTVEGGYKTIQRLESNDQWESLGFKVLIGNSTDGCKMVIDRPEMNSLSIKNELLSSSSILRIQQCENLKKEVEYVVNQIIKDISMELMPDDISVICLDNINASTYFKFIEESLKTRNIKAFNLLNAPSNNTIFKVKGHVTLTTVYNAKGNEAGSIYIMGIDTVFSHKDDIIERNKIFTAMTRSLAWVTMTGVGESVRCCINEVKELQENDFELHFVQPSEAEVRTIRQSISKSQKILNSFERLAENLEKETGLSKEDIVEQLKNEYLRKS